MSKFVTTTYSNQKRIPLVEGGLVSLPVTVNDANIAANSEGKKIVAAGTIVGGSVFADPANKVAAANTPGTVDLESTGANNDITITNKTTKAMKIQLVDPAGNSKPLFVQVINDTIQVSLATSGAGAITSTGAEVVALLNANPVTNELISAANKGTDTGAAAVTAVNATTIPAPTVVPEGVLLEDADVTNGPCGAAMAVMGILDLNKLAATPSAMAQKVLAGRIVFAK